MKVKTVCKHFTWQSGQLIDFNKIDQNVLKKPHCDLKKLDIFLNCPKDCKWFEKR
ncbi:MAG: hypothetical protein JSW60_03330 [Thermoplasmatales archaeon]|nr:MAG: hypothetical protein JSW60_03330 [Thermoplasmatales archaeon]